MNEEKMNILNSIRRYESIHKRELEMEKKRSFWKGITVAMAISILVYVWFRVF